MPIVSSTADILAIIGGATTFVAAVFAAIRLSRCQTVTCCWGALNLVNKPTSGQAAAAAAAATATSLNITERAPTQPPLSRQPSADLSQMV